MKKTFNTYYIRFKTIFFYVLIPLCIGLMIGNTLVNWYYRFQILKFGSNDTLLFINNNIAATIILFSPCMIVAFIIIYIREWRIKRDEDSKICIYIALITFIISVVISISLFSDYIEINKSGIYVNNVTSIKRKYYEWSDVEYAKVSYERVYRNNIKVSYDIYLNDGKVVHTYGSEGFFNNIVNLDGFMLDKDIKIYREKILKNDYGYFERSYKGYGRNTNLDRFEVLMKIFDK